MVILDDDVHRRAKEYASRRRTTLSAVVEEALQEKLAGRSDRPGRRRLRLPTFRGDGLLPGLSLDDLATIYDRMDRHG
jgi:hypothetical protein